MNSHYVKTSKKIGILNNSSPAEGTRDMNSCYVETSKEIGTRIDISPSE